MRDKSYLDGQWQAELAPKPSVLVHLERLFAAHTVAQIWELHVARMAAFGFDRLLYGYVRARQQDLFGSASDQQVLSNHDPAFIAAYVESGAYRDGYMTKLLAEKEGAFSWSLLEAARQAGRLSATETGVIELCRSFEVFAGYTISFRESAVRAKGIISLCAARDIDQAQVDAIWKRHGREILVCNQCMHLRVAALPDSNASVSLTRRQREVLEWVGYGKSVAEVAAAIGITKATAEKHLRLARAALSVDTTAQAVLKASWSYQIYASPIPMRKD